MSSFTIGKREYIKAAGIVAGIAEASARGAGIHQIWIYDYETRRNSTPEDYYRRFAECYTMNALSVAEQYHDREAETDSNEYKREFTAARNTGKMLFMTKGEKLKNAIMELRHFFHSAIYQTEKYEYMFKMQFYFYQIEDQLTEYLYTAPDDLQSWGSLEISA